MEFDVKKVTNEIIEFIKRYYKKNNLKGAVIGISGGKDSGVVAGLFTKALGKENVIGIWMPCHSKEEDKQNAILVANHFGFELKRKNSYIIQRLGKDLNETERTYQRIECEY